MNFQSGNFTSPGVVVEMDVDDSSIALDELVDLKMLPAWANEPAPAERYAHVQGEPEFDRSREQRPGGRGRRMPGARNKTHREAGRDQASRPRHGTHRERAFTTRSQFSQKTQARHPPIEQAASASHLTVRFLPRTPVLQNVVAQIKESTLAYSLFALARLFLAKPERYGVDLTAKPESPLYQLGENGAGSIDREFLERNAFRFAQNDFYKVEVRETEPIKGNFISVARDRLSGTVLGPTNHHDYQRRLRALFEQRFSRRMSFADYQRQIEIVTDPQLVEQWKEDARKVTSYSTSTEEPPMEFASALETERHFRDKYLPGLIRSVVELSVDGRTSRRLNDRILYRLIENEWTKETRSPSRMMQALATQFRQSGLQVFRHRRGMLFVSRIRPKPLVPDETAISVSVKSIIEAVAAHAGITRKELADKILANTAGDELERAKLSLAAELHWLIGEGHVIEFNDGSLDLPRVKAKRPEQGSAESVAPTVEASPPEDCRPSAPDRNSDGAPGDKQVDSTGSRSTGEVVAAVVPTGESEQALATSGSTTAEVEIGGS